MLQYRALVFRAPGSSNRLPSLAGHLTDPNEAFRYWSLFFRPGAFSREPQASAGGDGCWLDAILQGSREYAKRLGERLKDRIFLMIFPR